MTPAQAAVEVQVASDADVALAVEHALSGAGVTLDQLREQAKMSRFSSDRARTAWFVISPFVSHR